MPFFKSKKKTELTGHEKAIAIMYLGKSEYKLQDELDSGRRDNADSIWTANHDIQCIQKAIKVLEEN